MGKIQTRRSVSLRGDTYNALKARCEQRGVTMSAVLQDLITVYLEGAEPLAEAAPPIELPGKETSRLELIREIATRRAS